MTRDRVAPELAIERVMKLRHWTGSRLGPRYDCKCEECRAVKQVCALARETLARKT